jgi:hypothetical protein
MGLGQVGLGMAHQKLAQLGAAGGLVTQARGRQADGAAGNLGEGAVDGNARAQGVQHADNALIADGVALDGAPIDHDRDHRQHRRIGEIDPVDRVVRLVQHLAGGQGHGLGEGFERAQIGRGKRAQDKVSRLHLSSLFGAVEEVGRQGQTH